MKNQMLIDEDDSNQQISFKTEEDISGISVVLSQ
jgi:hypothetical protein